jgi:hypothetical protein
MKKLNQLRLTLASALLASLGFCGCRSINESVKDDRQQEKEPVKERVRKKMGEVKALYGVVPVYKQNVIEQESLDIEIR